MSLLRFSFVLLTASCAPLGWSADPSFAVDKSKWGKFSIVEEAETHRAAAERERERSQALQREAFALMSENNRLRDEMARGYPIGDLEANAPEVLKSFKSRYNGLLANFNAASARALTAEATVRQLQDQLAAANADARREKARADAAEAALKSGREEAGRVLEETKQNRIRANTASHEFEQMKAAATHLQKDVADRDQRIATLTAQLDRVDELERALEERDQLLQQAIEKLEELTGTGGPK